MSDLAQEAARLATKHPEQGPMGIQGVLLLVIRQRIQPSVMMGHIDEEDIIQDTYLDLIKQEGTTRAFDSAKAQLPTLAGTIARRRVTKACRRAAKHGQRLIEEAADAAPAAWGAPEEDVEREEFRANLGRAWVALNKKLERLHRTFELRCLRATVACGGDRSSAARAISKELGREITPQQVRDAVSRAVSYPEGRALRSMHEEGF